jgi:hypothetical protein
MIEAWREPFDLALALHACGNATDRVLQMAVARRAAYVVSPCCVGMAAGGKGGAAAQGEQPGGACVLRSSSAPCSAWEAGSHARGAECTHGDRFEAAPWF